METSTLNLPKIIITPYLNLDGRVRCGLDVVAWNANTYIQRVSLFGRDFSWVYLIPLMVFFPRLYSKN